MSNQQKINILTLNRLKVLNEKNESVLIYLFGKIAQLFLFSFATSAVLAAAHMSTKCGIAVKIFEKKVLN